MKIAIIGFGREGKSVLKFLKKRRDNEIKILDRKRGPGYLKNLSEFDVVYRSPGVPLNLPEIQKAIRAGVKVSSATKLFFDEAEVVLQRGSGRIVGVTGTKGKGTTSMLIYKILKASGKKALLAGNIGKSPLDILSKVTKDTLVVLELSSFQLWDLEKSPRVAVVTDVFPDHMDAHSGMKEYLDAKANISKHQKKFDAVFYFKSNALTAGIARHGDGKKFSIAAPDNLWKNRILAGAVARYLGCPENVIARAVKNYRGLKHRLEFVRAIKTHTNKLEYVRVSFYDDSASTNPQTTAAAIASFSEPIVLIAGGKDKNLDYAPLAKAIKKSGQVKLVVLIGENKNKILQAIASSKVKVVSRKDLPSAVSTAYKFAKNLTTNYLLPTTILFSPGAASFDMFNDYGDRGDQFKKIVRQLAD